MFNKFKSLKIKSQIVVITAFILGIILVFQIFLFSILQHENSRTVTSIFDSAAYNIATQINSLNEEISESLLLLTSHTISQDVFYEYSPVQTIQNSSLINGLLNDYLNSNKNISYIGFVKGGSLLNTAERHNLYNEASRIVDNLPAFKIINLFSPPTFIHEDIIYFPCVIPVFPSAPSNFSDRYSEDYIIFIYNMENITSTSSGVIDNNSIKYAITDASDRVLFSTNTDEFRKIFDYEKLNKKHLYKTIPLSTQNWNLTVYMPSENASVFSGVTVFFVVFMIFFTIIMLFLMLKLLNVIIVKRIETLKERVEKISTSDTTYRISYDYTDEFSVITTSINDVLDTVHNLNRDKLSTLDNLYKAQLLQKETQILYLYGQVSPHFLYNSLVHIQGLALSYNVKEIADMTVSLSKVFRYYSNNRSLSTIGQDIDFAIEYFNIINKRRTNKIKIINKVDPSLRKIPCLKMVYQPILENTLKHAYKIDDLGTVTISSVENEKMAVIEITDDGTGISPDKLTEINKSLAKTDLIDIQNGDNIGLLNVNMRLKLYYNNDCGLVISSEEGKGTTIRIVFEKETQKEKTALI